MSFSKEVKEELSKLNNLANKEELKYEFWGYLSSDNVIKQNSFIKYSTENDYNIDRFAKIIRNIGMEDFEININGKVFSIEFPVTDEFMRRRIKEEEFFFFRGRVSEKIVFFFRHILEDYLWGQVLLIILRGNTI